MAAFLIPEHQAVAAALRAMDHDLLMTNRCWFAGGTEIVLDLGEYRLSKDVDFLCADADGYREMRSLAATGGASALFGPSVREERTFRSDQYGIRGIVSADGIPLRFEIVREARISLEGRPDPGLGVHIVASVDAEPVLPDDVDHARLHGRHPHRGAIDSQRHRLAGRNRHATGEREHHQQSADYQPQHG